MCATRSHRTGTWAMSTAMFSKREVLQIFPTCLWIQQVANHEALNRDLDTAIAQFQPEGDLNPYAVGWQTPTDLQRRPEFEALTACFMRAAQNVLNYLKVEYEDFYITDCWANINRFGHSHSMHTHPNNYLSGVYYVKVPPNSGQIVFGDPRPQASAITPRHKENTIANSNQMHIDPEEGKLILFNSWLPHFVEVNQSGEERISIAFNVMLKGPIGDPMSSAQL